MIRFKLKKYPEIVDEDDLTRDCYYLSFDYKMKDGKERDFNVKYTKKSFEEATKEEILKLVGGSLKVINE